MTDLAALRLLRSARATAPIAPVRGHRQDLPLSFAQERLWQLDRLMPVQGPYLIRGADEIRGPLEVAALRAALNAVVARHEALRTTFPTRDGQPVQHIAGDLRLPLPVIEVPDRDTLRRRLVRHGTAPFDLATGPLIRADLYRLGADHHVLALAMHHIVSDGWSMSVLFDELAHFYRTHHPGLATPPPLADLPIQYADYAQWERRQLAGSALDRQLAYWRDQLRDAPPLLDLPTDRPRPPALTYRGDHIRFTLPAALTHQLNTLAKAHHATLFITLTAALTVLLHRYTGSGDITIGTPVANRTRTETEPLIGYFANTIVLRLKPTGATTYGQLLQHARDTALAAYDHQDLPFERLVQELRPERTLRHTPLFQVMLALQNTPEAPLGLPGLDVTPIDPPADTAKFDLWLSLKESADGLSGVLEYSTDLFDRTTAQRAVDHLTTILTAVAADPDRPIDRIPLLTPTERQHILTTLNHTATTTTTHQLVHHTIHDQAQTTPHHPAVTTHNHTLTYQDLDTTTNQLAHHLQHHGLKPETIAATYLPRSPELTTTLLAILNTGAAYLPLDPNHPPHRTQQMINDARPTLVITTSQHHKQLPPTDIPTILLDTHHPTIARQPTHPPHATTHPDNLAYAIYTSGSTGHPKAAMNTHRGLANRLQWMQDRYRLTPRDRVLHKTPASFDVSMWELLWPLMTGACQVVAEPEGHRDADYLVRAIREFGVTVVHFVPSMLEAFLDRPDVDCPGLRLVVSSGEALPPSLVRRFFDRLPHAELHNLYGPTEAAIDVTAWQCSPADADGPVPIGRPITNAETYILDHHHQPTPTGTTGQLHLAGTPLARGYLNKPALTAQHFTPHPHTTTPGQRLYHTGDLTHQTPNGTIHYHARTDHQIKHHGHRIEPNEINTTLQTHPHINQATTLIHHHTQQLTTYVTPSRLAGAEVAADGGARHVERWRRVFDEQYGRPPAGGDPALDFTGWNSSETGAALPEAAMREWVTAAADRIAGLRPRRVLEIGCGNGLVALRLAGACQRYVGTDICADALTRLAAAWPAGGAELRTLAAPAHEPAALGDERFDVIVLNSVVQYFPTVDYLLRVLDELTRRLEPGGRLFLGDVRGLDVLEAFHASVELARARDDLPGRTLRDRVGQRVSNEDELLLDPRLFPALGRRYPGLTAVAVLPRRGRSHNELTRFRFDVVLGFGAAPEPEPVWRTWEPDVDVAALLGAGEPVVALRAVRNARTWRAVRTAELLRRADVPATAGELRRLLDVEPVGVPEGGMDPEAVHDAARRAGYTAALRWSTGRTDGAFDVILRRPPTPAGAAADRLAGAQAPERGPAPDWSRYATDPLFVSRRHRLATELRELAAQRLPDYMVPQAIVVLPSLPLTPNGKVDRAALPAPGGERLMAADTYVAPRTALEAALAGVWAGVLGLDKVGVHDNFFELGGDSIRAIQVAARIAEAGRPAAARDLFGAQTVADLAAVLDGRPGAPSAPAVRRRPAPPPFALAGVDRDELAARVQSASGIVDAYPLAPLQDHMLHRKLDHPEPGLYVVHGIVPMSGRVDERALAGAWAWVVRRHPLLRTSFVWRHLPRPLQVVHRDAAPEVTVLDWRGVPAAERDRRMAGLLLRDRLRGHAPDQAPPLRVYGVQRTDDEYDLLISRDYVRLDGWSSRLYLGEFHRAYDRIAAGLAPEEPAPPPPYSRYMAWLADRSRVDSERFWRDSLGTDAPRSMVVGGDRSGEAAAGDPGGQVHDVAGLHVRQSTLDDAATAAVVDAARRNRVTLNTLVTAAWAATVSARTGRDDVLFGIATSGRTAQVEGVEAMVGVFLNVLPLRVRVPADRTLSRWLKDLSRQLVAVREHEHVSMRDAQRWAGLDPDGSPFDCCLVFQNLPALGAPNPAIRDRLDSDLPQLVQMEFPLRVDITHDGRIALLFTSRADRFAPGEADGLMAGFMHRLAAAPAALDRPARLLRHIHRGGS